jgi:hypothetical protein
VLAELWRRAGPGPAEIEKTVSTRLGDGEWAEQFAQRCRALDGQGVEHAIVLCAGPWTAAGWPRCPRPGHCWTGPTVARPGAPGPAAAD